MSTRFSRSLHPVHWLPWLLALAVWVVITRGYFPTLLRPASLHAFSGFVVTAPVVFIGLFGAFSLPKGWRNLVAIPFIAAVFASAMSGLHATTSTNTIYIAGLLPYSDAASYYWDALNLQDGRLFSDFASRRPIFAVMLSLLLNLMQNNLMAVQITMTFMTTAAIIMAALVVRRTFGAAAACLMVLLLLFFYRLFIGSTMTENLGILLGSLSMPLLLHAAEQQSRKYVLWGLAVLTVGLIVRAGPFISAATLAVWIAFAFFSTHPVWPRRALGVAIALAMIAGAFGYNKAVGVQVNSPGGVTFANFSHSLYGVSVGGERWNKVFEDHPDVAAMPVDQQTAAIYRLIWQNVTTHPEWLLRGIGTQYYYLVSPTWYNMFGYVESENKAVRLTAQYGLMALTLAGLFVLWRRRKEPASSMLLMLWLGILFSVPFVPPVDTNRMRAYATVIPYLALIPGIGLGWLIGLVLPASRMHKAAPEPSRVPLAAAIYSGVLLFALLLAPAYIKMRSAAEPMPAYTTCQEGYEPFVVRIPDGTYLHIRAERDFFLDRTPEIHAGRFRRLMHNMPFMDAVSAFESLESPLILTSGVNMLDGRVAWLTIPTDVFVASPDATVYCGNWHSRGEGMGNLFFKIDYLLAN